jgi:glycosyltransferase involved in cell wall biosynthesis
LHKGNHLITTGTITERKRSVELAEMALSSGTPILFVGKPYSEKDPYWQRFQSLIDNKIVMHRSHINSPQEMAELLRSARGFVLFSMHENWCLSAHEAAACGLPICVPDQNWSRERFGNGASYLLPHVSPENPERLRKFHIMAEKLSPPTISNLKWTFVAKRLALIYREVMDKESTKTRL